MAHENWTALCAGNMKTDLNMAAMIPYRSPYELHLIHIGTVGTVLSYMGGVSNKVARACVLLSYSELAVL